MEENIINNNISDSDKIFIEKKYNELMNKKGIILLNYMSDEQISKILELVPQYPNMAATVIEDEGSKQIVLRYKPEKMDYVDVKKLISVSAESYIRGEYDKCIQANTVLLELFKEPRAIVYSRIGLSYMKKGNIPLAIDYLTVANYLIKDEDIDLNYTEILLNLKGYISKEDLKPKVKMKEKDFNYNDVNSFYGIDNFYEITEFIINSGLDVESACKKLEFNEEQINIIKLIYAREYYIQKDFEKGDLFLKSVEKSKEKPDSVKRLLAIIKRNKKFYHNRNIENHKQLSLSLVPRKKK